MGPTPKTLVERFWSKVDKSGDCWVWTAGTSPLGYGRIYVNPGGPQLAHRVSWQLAHGLIPEGLYVCHHCDNPPCVRPEHLYVGTDLDNVRDMMNRGRGFRARGDQHGKTKLSEEQVQEIHRLRRSGLLQREIADRFGVHSAHISRVLNGKRREHEPQR